VKSIFVGNLDYGASEESLRALFETHGTVNRVNIVKHRVVGQRRGFGFVEMANDREGEEAIAALNGRDFDSRTLKVDEARSKAERSDGGAGGFGRQRW
jgi:RNA recognition motif-containing protein